jgi:ATP-binding cassette subfamily B protein/subfamily B ATP-binding cassette protein MsbA
MKPIFRVFSYLRHYPGLAAAQLFCAVGMTVAVVVFPEITRHIIDAVIPDPARHGEFPFWIALAAGGFLVRDGLNSARILVNNTFEQKVIFDIRSQLYAKLQRLPLPWFDKRRTGDIMTRVVEDVTAMERVLIDGIEQGLVASLQVLVVGTALYLNNATVALWATLPVPLLALGAWAYTHNARDRYRAQRNAASDLNALLHDNISGIRQIKAYAAEHEEHERFNEFSDALRRATLRIMRWWALYNPSMSFVSMLGYVLVLAFGGRAMMHGEMSVGELTGFFLLLSLFYEPISRLHQLNQMQLSARAAADRVFEILDTPDEPDSDGGADLARPVRGHIVFKDVSFSYGDRETLHKITLEAKPGETVALVGETGAGKSTVVNLIGRYYEYGDGSIALDGRELRDLAKRPLRDAIAYVSQDPFLFNGTVRENLLLARRDADDVVLRAALEAAHAAEFVGKLPDGLDTNVGERGVKLSGGEKQRISIARALLKDAPILILDEATASVDSATERQIQAALDTLMRDRTAFVIAHRLSTIRNADRIYVLSAGRIIEHGTHEELLASGETYADLCRKSTIGGT